MLEICRSTVVLELYAAALRPDVPLASKFLIWLPPLLLTRILFDGGINIATS